MLANTICSNVASAMATGATVIAAAAAAAAPVPVFPAIITVLQRIYDAVSEWKESKEEAARLAVYCGAMTASLSTFSGKVNLDSDATNLMSIAKESLLELLELLNAQRGRNVFIQIFTARAFKDATSKAEQEVNKALKAVMFRAQVQSMADIEEIKFNVEEIVRKRCCRAEPGTRMC